MKLLTYLIIMLSLQSCVTNRPKLLPVDQKLNLVISSDKDIILSTDSIAIITIELQNLGEEYVLLMNDDVSLFNHLEGCWHVRMASSDTTLSIWYKEYKPYSHLIGNYFHNIEIKSKSIYKKEFEINFNKLVIYKKINNQERIKLDTVIRGEMMIKVSYWDDQKYKTDNAILEALGSNTIKILRK